MYSCISVFGLKAAKGSRGDYRPPLINELFNIKLFLICHNLQEESYFQSKCNPSTFLLVYDKKLNIF